MVDTAIELNDTLILNDNSGIAVGFKSEDAIKPLKDIMTELSVRQIKNDTDWAAKQLNEVKKSGRIQEAIAASGKANVEIVKKSLSENEKTNRHLEELNNEVKQNYRNISAYLKTFLNVATKAVDNYMKNSVELANIFRDLESGGVFVKEGFDSLGQTAYTLGMTYEELAGHLKKVSPLIARLNNSLGNGVKTFENSMKKISDAYNLTHDEQVAVFEKAMENLNPSQLRQMGEQQLIARIDETAKQMKLLSLATGKSVENIQAETSARDKSLRIQAYQRSNPSAYNALKALGLDDDMVDYIASGGTRVNSKIAMQMANDPLRQAVYPELIRLARAGQLNLNTLGQLQARYGHLAQYKTDLALSSAQNQAQYAASAASPLYEYGVMDDSFGANFNNINTEQVRKEYESAMRQSSNAMLSSAQDYRENINRYETGKMSLSTGGTTGMNNAFNVFSKGYSLGGWALNGVNNTLTRLGLSGTTSAILSNALGGTVSSIGSYIGGKLGFGFSGAVNKFDRAVNKFSGSVGLTSSTFADNMWDGIFKKNKYGRKASILTRKYITGAGSHSISSKLSKMSPLMLAGRTAGAIGGAMGLMETILSTKGESGWDSSLKGIVAGAIMGGSMAGLKGAFWGAIGGAAAGYLSNVYSNWNSNKSIGENFGFSSGSSNSQMKPNIYGSINKENSMINSSDIQSFNQYQLTKETLSSLRNIERYSESAAYTTQQARMDNNLSGNKNNRVYTSQD